MEILPPHTTKVCSKCHRELPTTDFYIRNASKDGFMAECKECHKARYHTVGVKTSKLHPELADYKPYELIAELRRRGYKGTLTYLQEIKL